MRTLIAKTPLVRFRRPLVFTIGLLSLIIVGSTFLATRQTSKEALGTQTQDTAGVPIKMATVTQERLPLQITVIGTAEAYSSASVNSDVDGQLTELHLTEGQYRGVVDWSLNIPMPISLEQPTNARKMEVPNLHFPDVERCTRTAPNQ